MTTFRIHAALGDAALTIMGQSTNVDQLIDYWEQVLGNLAEDQKCSRTSQFIVETLQADESQSREVGYDVAAAQLWILSKGEKGPLAVSLMRKGNITARQDIISIEEGRYIFVTTFEEEAAASKAA